MAEETCSDGVYIKSCGGGWGKNKLDGGMDYLVSPQNPYIAVLTPYLNIFVDKVFKELNEGKWCPKGGALIQ